MGPFDRDVAAIECCCQLVLYSSISFPAVINLFFKFLVFDICNMKHIYFRFNLFYYVCACSVTKAIVFL